jgi:hypothetical protein
MMGSSAAALTGLVFIVITLINDQRRDLSEAGLSTFTTPTVMHFCGALFSCAVMAAPFRSLVPIETLLVLTGAIGLFYVGRVALRASRLESYQPDLEDWTWHVVLPTIGYAALIGSAIALHRGGEPALFATAAAVTLLIFIGIHNAWDVVTFLATGKADALPVRPAKDDEAEKTG